MPLKMPINPGLQVFVGSIPVFMENEEFRTEIKEKWRGATNIFYKINCGWGVVTFDSVEARNTVLNNKDLHLIGSTRLDVKPFVPKFQAESSPSKQNPYPRARSASSGRSSSAHFASQASASAAAAAKAPKAVPLSNSRLSQLGELGDPEEAVLGAAAAAAAAAVPAAVPEDAKTGIILRYIFFEGYYGVISSAGNGPWEGLEAYFGVDSALACPIHGVRCPGNSCGLFLPITAHFSTGIAETPEELMPVGSEVCFRVAPKKPGPGRVHAILVWPRHSEIPPLAFIPPVKFLDRCFKQIRLILRHELTRSSSDSLDGGDDPDFEDYAAVDAVEPGNLQESGRTLSVDLARVVWKSIVVARRPWALGTRNCHGDSQLALLNWIVLLAVGPNDEEMIRKLLTASTAEDWKSAAAQPKAKEPPICAKNVVGALRKFAALTKAMNSASTAASGSERSGPARVTRAAPFTERPKFSELELKTKLSEYLETCHDKSGDLFFHETPAKLAGMADRYELAFGAQGAEPRLVRDWARELGAGKVAANYLWKFFETQQHLSCLRSPGNGHQHPTSQFAARLMFLMAHFMEGGTFGKSGGQPEQQEPEPPAPSQPNSDKLLQRVCQSPGCHLRLEDLESLYLDTFYDCDKSQGEEESTRISGPMDGKARLRSWRSALGRLLRERSALDFEPPVGLLDYLRDLVRAWLQKTDPAGIPFGSASDRLMKATLVSPPRLEVCNQEHASDKGGLAVQASEGQDLLAFLSRKWSKEEPLGWLVGWAAKLEALEAVYLEQHLHDVMSQVAHGKEILLTKVLSRAAEFIQADQEHFIDRGRCLLDWIPHRIRECFFGITGVVVHAFSNSYGAIQTRHGLVLVNTEVCSKVGKVSTEGMMAAKGRLVRLDAVQSSVRRRKGPPLHYIYAVRVWDLHELAIKSSQHAGGVGHPAGKLDFLSLFLDGIPPGLVQNERKNDQQAKSVSFNLREKDAPKVVPQSAKYWAEVIPTFERIAAKNGEALEYSPASSREALRKAMNFQPTSEETKMSGQRNSVAADDCPADRQGDMARTGYLPLMRWMANNFSQTKNLGNVPRPNPAVKVMLASISALAKTGIRLGHLQSLHSLYVIAFGSDEAFESALEVILCLASKNHQTGSRGDSTSSSLEWWQIVDIFNEYFKSTSKTSFKVSYEQLATIVRGLTDATEDF